MKWIFIILLVFITAPIMRGQDSPSASAISRQEAVENYKSLKAQVDVLIEGRDAQSRMIQELKAEIRDLRTQLNKPSGNFATPEDVKTLAEAIKEVDRKRIADNKELLSEVTNAIGKLSKTLVANPPLKPAGNTPKPPAGGTNVTELAANKDTGTQKPTDKPTDKPAGSDDGFWYVIKANDTFRSIAKAYSEQLGVKVKWEDIAAANPNVKDTNMIVGKKLWIPAKPPVPAK